MKQLTWKVDKTISEGCPDYQPDPYTGEYPATHCLVYHYKNITEEKTAEFPTEKDAKEFVNNAPFSCYDFRLNGKPVKDKRKKPDIKYYSGLSGSNTVTL